MTRRSVVPQGLDDANKVIFGRSVGDIFGYIVLPVMATIFITAMGIVDVAGFLFGLSFTVTSAIILYRLAGPGTPVTEYLISQIHYARLPPRASPHPARDDPVDEPRPLADGGQEDFDELVNDFTEKPENVKFWEAKRDAAEFTGVANVFPQFDVIQQIDGKLISYIKIEGTDINLKSDEEGDILIQNFEDYLNRNPENFSVFVTTEPFDFNSHVEQHQEKATHDVIKNNPILSELHQSYEEEILNDRHLSNTRERVSYIIIEVDPEEQAEIQAEDAYEDNDDMSDIAAVAFFQRHFGTSGTTSDFDEDELKELRNSMEEMVEQRRSVRNQIRGIDESVDAKISTYQEILGRLRGHYRGPMEYQEIDVASAPITPPENYLQNNRESTTGRMSE